MAVFHAAVFAYCQSFAILRQLAVTFLFGFAGFKTFRGIEVRLRHCAMIRDVFFRFSGTVGFGFLCSQCRLYGEGRHNHGGPNESNVFHGLISRVTLMNQSAAGKTASAAGQRACNIGTIRAPRRYQRSKGANQNGKAENDEFLR